MFKTVILGTYLIGSTVSAMDTKNIPVVPTRNIKDVPIEEIFDLIDQNTQWLIGPNEIFHLNRKEIVDHGILDLSGQLTKIPKVLKDVILKAIPYLHNLREIYLDDCAIEVLDDNCASLINLEVLSLSGNNLTSIPEWISKLTKLRALDLGNNKLESFPQEIKELSNLEYVSVAYNDIDILPEWINDFKKLTTLVMDNTKYSASSTESIKFINQHTIVSCNYNPGIYQSYLIFDKGKTPH